MTLGASLPFILRQDRSPQLNTTENFRRFMRNNRLSRRIFQSHDDILDHRCRVWNKIVSRPGRIASFAN